MSLPIKDLSTEAFAPYGQIIEQPQRGQDAAGPGWRWWGEMVKMQGGERPYAIGYLDLSPAELQFDWAERHMHSDELIIPIDGDCLVYAAPADYPDQPDRMPELDRFEVFRVKSGQAVLLNKGVWHGAPMAVDRPLKAIVLLLHNSSQQDGYVNRFVDTPLTIEKP